MTNDRRSKSQTELKKNNKEHFVSIHLEKKNGSAAPKVALLSLVMGSMPGVGTAALLGL